MVVGIIGESCVGKSTMAQALQEVLDAEVVTGKDYLRLAKSESMAAALFKKKLKAAITGENVIYVISEKEHLAFLPEGSTTILVTAELDTIKERFRARMRGNLPAPVEPMLEKKHGMFEDGTYTLRYHSGRDTVDTVLEKLRQL